MKFDGSKIAHEHIYWDQASVLVQIGLFEEQNLPITGIQQAPRLVELSKD
jgi:carboxymethylenebutenolidase